MASFSKAATAFSKNFEPTADDVDLGAIRRESAGNHQSDARSSAGDQPDLSRKGEEIGCVQAGFLGSVRHFVMLRI